MSVWHSYNFRAILIPYPGVCRITWFRTCLLNICWPCWLRLNFHEYADMDTWVQRWLGCGSMLIDHSAGHCFPRWMCVPQPIPFYSFCAMGDYLTLMCLVRSSLTNILRCPGSSGGCALEEVGLLLYLDPSWHIPFLPVLNGYSRSLPRYGLVVSRPVSSYLPWVHQRTPAVCSAILSPPFLTLDPAVYASSQDFVICGLSALAFPSARVIISRWDATLIHLPEFFSDNTSNMTGCGKPIFQTFRHLLIESRLTYLGLFMLHGTVLQSWPSMQFSMYYWVSWSL